MAKGSKVYVLVTQCFIQMFVLMYLGYKLGGTWWLNNSVASAILCVVGALIGLINLVATVMKEGDVFDKRKDIQ